MHNEGKSRLHMIAAMVIFGSISIFVRNIGISSGELALCRALIAAVLIGLWLAIRKEKFAFPNGQRELVLLLVSGAAMGFNWILLFQAYRYTTVSMATLSYYFAPVIVTVVSTFILREKLTAKRLLCFVMSTAGLVLMIGARGAGGGSDLTGIMLGLGAAALYATVVLMNKMIRAVSGLQRTFLQFAAAAAVLLPYVLLTDGLNLGRLDGKGWICLLTVGVVHSFLAYCLYFTALSRLPGVEVSILSYIDPLAAVLVSLLIFGESMTWQQVVGGLCILGFTLWNELGESKEKETDSRG